MHGFVRAFQTGGVMKRPPPFSEVLTLSILEGKGGNPERGYPSILPGPLCLSCSLCLQTAGVEWWRGGGGAAGGVEGEKEPALNLRRRRGRDTQSNNVKPTHIHQSGLESALWWLKSGTGG